jgi:hypothetical protein
VLYEGQVQQTGSHFNPAWPRRAGLYGFLGYFRRFFSVAAKKASFDMGLCKSSWTFVYLGQAYAKAMPGVLRSAVVYSRRQVAAAAHFEFRFEGFVCP